MKLIHVDVQAIQKALDAGQRVMGVYHDSKGVVTFPPDAIVKPGYITFDGVHEEQFEEVLIISRSVAPVDGPLDRTYEVTLYFPTFFRRIAVNAADAQACRAHLEEKGLILANEPVRVNWRHIHGELTLQEW